MDIYTLTLLLLLVLLYSIILLGVVLGSIEDKRFSNKDNSHVISRAVPVTKEIWKSDRFEHEKKSILINL